MHQQGIHGMRMDRWIQGSFKQQLKRCGSVRDRDFQQAGIPMVDPYTGRCVHRLPGHRQGPRDQASLPLRLMDQCRPKEKFRLIGFRWVSGIKATVSPFHGFQSPPVAGPFMNPLPPAFRIQRTIRTAGTIPLNLVLGYPVEQSPCSQLNGTLHPFGKQLQFLLGTAELIPAKIHPISQWAGLDFFCPEGFFDPLFSTPNGINLRNGFGAKGTAGPILDRCRPGCGYRAEQPEQPPCHQASSSHNRPSKIRFHDNEILTGKKPHSKPVPRLGNRISARHLPADWKSIERLAKPPHRENILSVRLPPLKM